ncbi:hypothetical protein EEJ31_07255 [Cryobacterium tepidiphilum]|uniref:Helicase n=1 Tax=Cryobacterium tepidiphilum TaxID=2486026 RepID=A0A3M8LAU0_9MICO|nr:hypothetical protein EEJ31_07255 [Cryobacterium tepidiphilum]
MNDLGSGSVLAVAILGACLLLTAVLVPALAMLALGQGVQGAADAAALAAADTASGAVPGIPCEAAAAAAALNGATVAACRVDDLIATVAVERRVAGFRLGAEARAGPPRANPERANRERAFKGPRVETNASCDSCELRLL